MERRSLGVLAGLFMALLGAWLLTASRGPERLGGGPLVLSTLSGEKVAWGSCPAAKCLSVYVAPWCGVCRASTPFINAVVAYLNAHGAPARVVVGQGTPEQVAAYAKDFGPGTLLDPGGRVPLAGGVPQFIVTAADGTVLKRQPGVPRIIPPPIAEADVRELASYLGLP